MSVGRVSLRTPRLSAVSSARRTAEVADEIFDLPPCETNRSFASFANSPSEVFPETPATTALEHWRQFHRLIAGESEWQHAFSYSVSNFASHCWNAPELRRYRSRL